MYLSILCNLVLKNQIIMVYISRDFESKVHFHIRTNEIMNRVRLFFGKIKRSSALCNYYSTSTKHAEISRGIEPFKNIPGPRCWPIVGTLMEYKLGKKNC